MLPLLPATGAGAEMRDALGVAVFGGMLGVTLFGIFFTPVVCYAIRRLTVRRQPAPKTTDKAHRAARAPVDPVEVVSAH